MTVLEKSYYVLGDNAEHSLDSRYWEDPFRRNEEIVAEFCTTDISCRKYIGQTGCESLILNIRQAEEWSGCNASDVRQKLFR